MSPNEEVFVCSCQEHLKSTEDVNEHLRGDKNWSNDGHGRQCRFPGCKTILPQTSNAKRHWKTHLPKRLRNYFCPKCDESYAKREQLEKHMAAPVCLKNRKRCRSVFEEDSAPAIPPITSRNDMSSSDGHAADLRTTSGVPSSNISQSSTTYTPSLDAAAQKAWLEEQQQAQVAAGLAAPQPLLTPPSMGSVNNFLPAAILEQYPALAGLDWNSVPHPPPDDYSDLSDNELGTQPSSDEWRNNTSSLRSTRERRTGSPTPAPLDKRGFHHIQHPNDTRANTGAYTCKYHSCTQRFESHPALQRHERDFHRSQEHNDNDSGAKSGTASVSPRPHARPVLRSDHTHVPHVQPPKHRFTIGRSQESQLGDLRMRYAGRELKVIHVSVAGCWGSVGSLLSDLTENVRFEHQVWPGPSSTSLWGAVTKAIPPEVLNGMADRHIHYIHVCGRVSGSHWVVDLEWTEEGITSHWQELRPAFKLPGGTARSIVVSTLS
jgi:hypothetical protein